MSDKKNNDDLSCSRDERSKGRDYDINPECGINNSGEDLGINTNDEEDPDPCYY